MKAFISVKIALLRFALFWLASGLGYPLNGALSGAVLAAATIVYRMRRFRADLIQHDELQPSHYTI